jgi:hypothetical protein
MSQHLLPQVRRTHEPISVMSPCRRIQAIEEKGFVRYQAAWPKIGAAVKSFLD